MIGSSTLAQVSDELTQILGRMQDFVPVFDYVGGQVRKDVQERIRDTKIAPDGTPWAPWRPLTERLRHLASNAEQGLLWDSGVLLESIHLAVDGSFELAVGTDVPYSITLQEGVKGSQESREFLGWTETEYGMVETAVINYLNTGFVT